MASAKISELPAASSAALTDELPVNQGGVTKSITVSQIRDVVERFWSSGIPFVMQSSGTIGDTVGTVTVTTAFDYAIGPSYSFFPHDGLYAASPAGWYYTNWTSTTVGTVYADTYYNGTPTIPTSPTPLTTVAGSYTQATGFDVIGPVVVVPGGIMGVNGYIEYNHVFNNNNSAGTKTYNTYLAGFVMQGGSQTTNPKSGTTGTVKNRGATNSQICANSNNGDATSAGSHTRSAIETNQNQIFGHSVQIATATDYAIIESWYTRVIRG